LEAPKRRESLAESQEEERAKNIKQISKYFYQYQKLIAG
jgi:hypothetical protein